jgi:UDP-GlcNAc:undecaprenyl-phosphate GlcNAc-1-phosphate transferase
MTKAIGQTLICLSYLLAVRPDGFTALFAGLAFLVLLVNAFNHVDVMDGLLIVVSLVAIIGLRADFGLGSSMPDGAAILAGALLAALWFNRPTARIYLGDGGALGIGFLLGACYLTGVGGEARPTAIAQLGAFAIPILEVLLLTGSRLSRGDSPFRGSPDHYSLRLQDHRSWSATRILIFTAFIGSVFVLPTFVEPVWLIRLSLPIGGATLLIAAGAMWYCWRLRPNATSWVASA